MEHMDMVDILDPMTPLRDPQGTLDTLRAGIIANGEALQAVNAGLVSLPVAAIKDNRGAIGKVTGRLKRTANGFITRNATTIGQVVQMLAGSVAGGLAGNAAALQTVQEVASTGGRLATPTLVPAEPPCATTNCVCLWDIVCQGPPEGFPTPTVNYGVASRCGHYAPNGNFIDDNGRYTQAIAVSGTLSLSGTFGVVIGNFPTSAAAIAVIPSRLADIEAMCGGSAPAPSATWNIWYYCDPCADPAGLHNWQAGVFPSNPGGKWLLFQGAGVNFASQPAAQAALDSAGALLDSACQYAPGSCHTGPTPAPAPSPEEPPAGEQCKAPPEACPLPPKQTVPGGACEFQPPAIGIPESTLCATWPKIVEATVAIGKEVHGYFKQGSQASLAGWSAVKFWIMSIFHGGGIDPSVFPQLQAFYSQEAACDLLDSWTRVVSVYVCIDAEDIVYAMALRAVLQMFADIKLDASATAAVTRQSHTTSGVELFQTGGHYSSSVDEGDHNALGIAIKTVIVPAIDLVDRVIAHLCPHEIPDSNAIVDAWLASTLTDDEARCLLRMHGMKWDDFLPMITARRTRLQDWEYIQYSRRFRADDDAIKFGLRTYGYIRESDASARVEMSYELPTISDHLHWLQRNVFDTSYVQQYNLLDGFADDATIQALPGFAAYVQRFPLGRSNFWSEFGPDLHALGMRIEYAARHYAAHWVQPSMGQLGEMVCRLRPGRVDESIQFTPEDFVRLLGENDIAPFFRQRLLNILYRTFPLRQLNQAAQQGRFTYDDLYQRWQDLCFSPFDADIMAHTTLVQAARTSATQGKGWTAATISALAEEGLIDFNTAVARLQPQGFTPEQVTDLFDVAALKKIAADRKRYGDKAQRDYAGEALKALEDGYVDAGTASNALISAGYPPDAAALEIQTALLRAATKATAQATAAIKRAFTRGDLDRAGAVAALESVGVQAGPAAQMVGIWALAITPRKRSLAKAEAIRLYTEGIMTQAELATRLTNLGYNPHDITMMLAEAKNNIDRALARTEQRSAAALARAEKDTAAASAAILRGYCRLWPAGKLVKLFALRIIDESDISAKRAKCGDSPESIADLIKQATVARDKLDAEASKKGPAGIQYTGPDSISGGPTA